MCEGDEEQGVTVGPEGTPRSRDTSIGSVGARTAVRQGRSQHAELVRVSGKGHGCLELSVRLTHPTAAATVHSLVAVHRGDQRELELPITSGRNGLQVVLPLKRLLLLAPQRWDTLDLNVRLVGADSKDVLVRLRPDAATAAHLLAQPRQMVLRRRWPAVPRAATAELYVTQHGNLSLRVRPFPPPPNWTANPRPPAPAVVRWLFRRWFERVEGRTEIARRARAPLGDDRPRVYFVIRSVYGMGGTVRTVVTTANYLAAVGYRVTVVSLLRPRQEPFFPLHRRIRLVPLWDERSRSRPTPPEGTGAPLRTSLRDLLYTRLDGWESVLTHPREATFRRTSLLTDLLLVRALQRLKPGVAVLTRPVLNVAGARFASADVRTIGQEHMNFSLHDPEFVRWMLLSYQKLDALTVLTDGDRRDYREALRAAPVDIRMIPNGLPALPEQVSDHSAQVVVAAGRLTRQKGFDLLIRAFESLAVHQPGWVLRIFGDGPEHASLQQQIERSGLEGVVQLMGRTQDVYGEMARASVFALSSRFEGFGMVIIEAMSVALPVVSFDCPRGPADIITHGQDGLLVPPEDVEALSAALEMLLGDTVRRRAMGLAARRTASQYAMDRVGQQWEQIICDLSGRAGSGGL